jgi:glycosyltransferase involved in cell wall biosynthesis
MKGSWLIISYFANIDAMAPSHHIDDRLLFFKKEGIGVHLLSSPCGVRNREISHTRVPSPAPSGIRYEVRYLLRRNTKRKFWFKFWETLLLLPVLPFYFFEKLLLRLDSTWSWFITASFAAVVLSLKKRPAVIYSTGGPVSAHLAALAASAVTGIPYIAEFQDPLVHEYAAPGKCERYFMELAERFVFKTAAAVVFLTRQAAMNASSRNPDGINTFTIYAGATPPDCAEHYEKGDTFRVAHFGSLGGSRNLGRFLSALEVLFRDHPSLAGEFRLDLYGNSSRAVRTEIEKFPYRNALRIYGKVNRPTAVESMQAADVLLLIQNTDDVSFETIPSKVYEYLHSGRPILALVYRNAELQTILETMGHLVVQADDTAGIKKALEAHIAKWREGKLKPSDVPSPYTVEAAVCGLIQAVRGLHGKRQS